ncbi:MAG: hypothetical protein N2202_07920 [Proteobacteria bacterium]|nr:hypothetical protein [Pseudomonadota bacterium]
MRRESIVFLVLVFLLTCLSLVLIIDAHDKNSVNKNKNTVIWVKKLGLTDLALFSDASYIRHISQSDMFAPFQDNPSSFDIFPTASLVPPTYMRERE